MRLLFAGTPSIGVPALVALAESFDVRGVLTNPDAVSGRKRVSVAPPVKIAALELGLPIFQPRRLDPSATAEIREVGAELLIVVAYGKILKDDFLAVFPAGGLNLHPSLLPRYRGPSPIPAAIAAGDPFTGVTVQRIAHEVDSGNILLQRRLDIEPRDTTATVSEKVALIGADMLMQAVRAVESGAVVERSQDHSQASFCRLLTREDGRIDWGASAAAIDRTIRAYTPTPLAFTDFRGRILLIHEACVFSGTDAPQDGLPGVVLGSDTRYGVLISTGCGILCVSKLQLESKRMLDWRSFLNGNRDLIGSRLGGER